MYADLFGWDKKVMIVPMAGIVVVCAVLVILFVRSVEKFSAREICLAAMFAAVISVLSILKIPTPWGVPFTLQTFAVALCGYVLGKKYSMVAVMVYILLGFVGLPVYSGMTQGPGVVFGPTGGYLIGFVGMAFFCGYGYELFKEKKSRIPILVGGSFLGLLCCHGLGIFQLKLYYEMAWAAAALAGTVPYLLKDVISLFLACILARSVKLYKTLFIS